MTTYEQGWASLKNGQLLAEAVPTSLVVPEWPQLIRGCIKYRQSLDEQAPDAPHSTKEFGSGGNA
ncbi:MAG: hypothetical protein AB4911_20905 [Oscillochloridaceae bacterium umkhey_bin13]